MGRQPIISREQLLQITRAVFQEHGFRSTTAEIAKRAGISEGALFKRFKTKQELLKAAISHIDQNPPWILGLAGRIGQTSVEGELEGVALEFMQFARILMPCVLMAHTGSGDRGHRDVADGPPPPVRIIKAMTVYFEAEMRLGRIRVGDAEIVARCFIGPIMHFVMLELMHQSFEYLPLSAEGFVRVHIQILLRGIL